MKYRLKKDRGNHYVSRDGQLVKLEPGELVELSETQAKSFGDKFEPVGKTAAPATKAKTKAKAKSGGR